MILYPAFYRKYGIRNPSYLVSPNPIVFQDFEFPRSAIWHYVPFDGVGVGPSSSEFVLRNVEKRIFVQHIGHLTSTLGEPRVVNTSREAERRDFHMRNKRFRRIFDATTDVTDDNSLIIINYAGADKNYTYVRSVYRAYYAWYNMQKTVFMEMERIANKSERDQYLFVDIPKTLPPISKLDRGTIKLDQDTVNTFNTPEHMFLLELWKWISPDTRNASMFDVISVANLKKINIVFKEGDRWTILNLGMLNSWRFVKTEIKAEKQEFKLDPKDMQKRILRSYMSMMETRTVTTVDDSEAPVESSKEETESTSDTTKHQEIEAMLSNMDADLKQLETLDSISEEEPVTVKLTKGLIKDGVVDPKDFDIVIEPQEQIKAICDRLTEDGLMSGGEYNKFRKHIEKFNDIDSPEKGVKLKDYVKIAKEQTTITAPTKIRDSVTIPDKSMLETTLIDFDKKYIENVLQKDIAGMVVAAQSGGLVVTNYEVSTEEDILGKFAVHSVRLNPIVGAPSTVHFKIPVFSPSGEFKSGGVLYRFSKQRSDMPIRQINPSRVALTTYYGKSFVTRSEKRVNDYGNWVRTQIMSRSIGENVTITDVNIANVFDHEFEAPRIYTAIAQNIASFTFGNYSFNFNHKEREALYGADTLKKYEKRGSLVVGKTKQGEYIVLDKDSFFYETNAGSLKPIGPFETMMGLDATHAPVEFSETKVYGKSIPTGIVLAYLYGLDKLLQMLKVTPRRVNAGQRLNLQDHEYAVVFSDETLIFSKEDRVASLLLAGFREYEKATKNYSVYTFDKKGVYLNVLEHFNISARYLREIELMDKMFVDPISRELLQEMKEPETFRGLLVRATELLTKDYHPHSLDMRFMRLKGNERVAGAIYTEMVNAIREHGSRIGKANFPIELHPYAVWKRVTEDSSKMLVNDINPIQNLKESEAVTFGGTGGRNSRSMTRDTREHHTTDKGVISEATRDSSDAGISTFTSANPNLNSVRGTVDVKALKDITTTSLLSTSALLAPGSDKDDPKRVNFINIQQSHSVACNGYTPSYVRTGYEQVLISRVGEGYGNVAKQDGKVIGKTKDGLTIEYKDGTKEGFVIGRRFGKAPDFIVPHTMHSDLQEGAKFKAGDILTYNSGYFQRDSINPDAVVWKAGVTTRVALLESRATHEDASSISKALATKLVTQTTKIKQITVEFGQTVKNLVEVGSKVDHDTVLCIIQDSTTTASNLFDDRTLNTLRALSSQTPTAKLMGTVERIEVYYHGDKEDMSPTLKAIADASDRSLAQRNKAQSKQVFTGSVDESFRIDGEPLLLDTLAIRVYITADVSAGVGDKVVIANQMKSVVSEVLDHEVTTEDGQPIDVIFGAQSIYNRIVTSPFVLGTTNVLLGLISEEAARIYESK